MAAANLRHLHCCDSCEERNALATAQSMSEHEMVKKQVEEEALGYYLKALHDATGERLLLWPSERPDFIGYRSDGSPVGVELTSVRWAPEARSAAEILNYGEPYGRMGGARPHGCRFGEEGAEANAVDLAAL